MTVLDILKRVPIFSNISARDLGKIKKILKKNEYKKGEHVFSERDEGDEFYIVKEGRIKIFKMSNDGQVKTLDYLKKDDFFGEMALLDKNPRSANALAIHDTTLFIIKNDDFRSFLVKQPDMLMTITQTLCNRLRKTNMEIEMFSFKKVRDRLIACLVYLAEKYGTDTDKGVEIAIDFTHQDLSEYVGTAREVISRLLKKLSQERLIISEKRHIIIPSVADLRKKLVE